MSGLVDSTQCHLLPFTKDLVNGVVVRSFWSMKEGDSWGEMTLSKGSSKIRNNLLSTSHSSAATFEGFLRFEIRSSRLFFASKIHETFIPIYIAANTSVLATLHLNPCPTTELEKIKSVLDRPSALPKVEPLISQWIQTVQRVSVLCRSGVSRHFFGEVSKSCFTNDRRSFANILRTRYLEFITGAAG